MHFSFDKFANAVVLVLHERPGAIGLTVLVKLLFRADFEHYRQHLRPITGLEYVALERGPVPHEYRNLFRMLVQRGYLSQPDYVDVAPGMNPMESYRPLREPMLEAFEESELEVLRSVVASDGHKTGVTLSDETHAELPWRAVWADSVGNGEVIPYSLARWEDNRCTEKDADAARQTLADPDVQRSIAEFMGHR